MSRLTDLLREAKKLDPKLGDALEEEVRHLQQRRAFGLNFERHTPEAVELYGRPVRVGDKVRMLPPRGQTVAPDKRLWIVTEGGTVEGVKRADLLDPKTGDVADHPVDDLVVVAEHTDVIYPGLVSTGKVERGGGQPFHTVINGENLHVLKAMLYTHAGKVDCIYIDPPYNTGNDGWIYNDRYVTNDDLYRHSKWLAFMERRLKLARELLKETGVILVAIGDEEHHRLRLLMDQVFHEGNFLCDLVWQGRVKNDKRFTGGGVDYMLCYSKDVSELVRVDTRWVERKPGVVELLQVARRAFQSQLSGGRPPAVAAGLATEELRAWARTQKGQYPGGILAYTNVDAEGRVFQPGPLDSPNPRPNLTYPVLHPITGKAVPTPAKGWRVSREVMDQMAADGEIVWGADHTTGIRRKLILDQESVGVPAPTFVADRDSATKLLVRQLGEPRFPNPKSLDVMMRWLGIVAHRDAVILDFFGGSGTTVEAVARLNVQDGGTRQCILVTNNEVGSKEATVLRGAGYRPGDPEWEAKGVHQYVTRPRIVAVTTGERPDGALLEDTVAANVDFLNLTYEAPLTVSTNHAFGRIAPLLWLRAGSRGRRIESLPNGWDVAEAYGVIERLENLDEFVTALQAELAASVAFIVTDDDRRFQAALAQLPDGVEPVRLYESYLRNFQIDAVRSTR